jgi:DoxX-like family
MARKVMYWASTVIVAALSVFAAFSYLMAGPDAVAGFAHVGYPQQLRVMLGIAKLSGAIALVIPGVPKLKEWAYAGFTFAWIAAFVAHYLAGDGPISVVPLVLLVLLGISYVTRPGSRQWQAKPMIA